MAVLLTDKETLHLFRQAFDAHTVQIQQFLETNRCYVLLRNSGALTEEELGDTIKGKRSEIAKHVVSTVRGKDNLDCYMRFSGVMYGLRDGSTGRRLFSFVEYLMDIYVYPKPRQVLHNPAAPQGGSSVPTVLWLVTSKSDQEVVSRILQHFRHNLEGPTRTINSFQCKEIQLGHHKDLTSPMRLCLVSPGDGAQRLNLPMVSDLLRTILPQPCLAVLSGTCVARETDASLGDIVVVARTNTLPISAEVQHMTELWRLRQDAKWVKENLLQEMQPRRSHMGQIKSLARLYAELKSPKDERTQWFTNLSWDSTKPVTESLIHHFQHYVPDPQHIWHTQEAGQFWTPCENDVLPFAPSEALFSEAKASMRLAHTHYPLPQSGEPRVTFKKTGLFRDDEVCCPDAVRFYLGAQEMEGMQYLAVLGVSQFSEGCVEPDYKTYASYTSAMYLYQVVDYLRKELSKTFVQ